MPLSPSSTMDLTSVSPAIADGVEMHDIELQHRNSAHVRTIDVSPMEPVKITTSPSPSPVDAAKETSTSVNPTSDLHRSASIDSISVNDDTVPLMGWLRPNLTNSLPESYSSVPVAHHDSPWYQKLRSFIGIGLMISVGYIDPGNWSTDIAGGAGFGYSMLFVIFISSLSAMLLQYLSMKLGVATQRDLAQAIRDSVPLWVASMIWVVMELAIAATDLAEVLGSAVALNLLFNLPLAAGVAITAADVLLILIIEQKQIRLLEVLIGALTLIIVVIFCYELSVAKPYWPDVFYGLLPSTGLVTNPDQLFIAIGIIGATVMPHNLFLHSALIQTRNYERTAEGKQMAVKYAMIDSNCSLSVAFFVNAFILILAAAAFHMEHSDVADIFTAYTLLSPTVGVKAASILFAVALLASGQQASFTGTLAGQIVMEGLIQVKLKPWKRRILTRGIALLPALIVTLVYNSDSAVNNLLIISQVILSITLSFATIPLVYITSTKLKMTDQFVNNWAMTIVATFVTIAILGLNVYLIVTPATYEFSA